MNVLDLARLDELIASKDSDEREWVYPEDIEEHCRAMLESIKSGTSEQLKLLALHAMCAGDIIHNFRYLMSQVKEPTDFIVYNTVVRLRGNSLSADWVRYAYRKKGETSTRVFSDHVTKGKSHSYSLSKFSKAGKVELGFIKIVEAKFGKIRKAAASLKKMRDALREYENDLDNLFALEKLSDEIPNDH